MAMVFWLIIVAVACCVTAVLVASTRKSAGDSDVHGEVDSDIAVYKDQLAEIDRDLARGVLSDEEAEQVRLEVSRRLLDADKRKGTGKVAQSDSPRLALVFVSAVILIGGGTIYAAIGVPGYSDLPIKSRLAALDKARGSRMSQIEAENQARAVLPQTDEVSEDYLALMERLRTALEERPDDIQGLTLLAQNEARIGRYAEARAAQERLLKAKGEDAVLADHLRLLDVMVFAAAGYVSPEAEALLQDVLQRAPESGPAQYYLGLV